jgi:predicted amidohydrolase
MGAEQHQLEELLEELKGTRGDDVHTVAVLWTWLEERIVILGSLREKPPMIYRAAIREPRFEGVDDEVLAWIASNPVRNAAELLARIGQTMGEAHAELADTAVGFRGKEVIVAWRVSELVKRAGGSAYPPSAVEHPSLCTLAPSLIVCPRYEDGIELVSLRPEGKAWEAVKRSLDRGLSYDSPSFEVHMDTLGEHGRSGWFDDDSELGCYEEDKIDSADQEQCEAAARSAVNEASGRVSIVVVPELAATPKVLDAFRAELADLVEGPVLTVVGRYHREADGDEDYGELAAADQLAKHVNEAAVLDLGGTELWGHRKLTSAQGRRPAKETASEEGGGREEQEDGDGGSAVIENIRVGDRLTVVPTPLGNVAVLICLDAFAEHAQNRIAKSHANVLLVPSLSPHVNRHRDALKQLVQRLWAIAFVCNRSPEGEGEEVWNQERNRSFWVVAGRGFEPPERGREGHHSFVFRLGHSNARNQG